MTRKLLDTTQFAKSKGVTPGRIRQLVNEGRIPEAEKVGDSPKSPWVIPENARILMPPERKRGFDKIQEWVDSDEPGTEKLLRQFIEDSRYWLNSTE